MPKINNADFSVCPGCQQNCNTRVSSKRNIFSETLNAKRFEIRGVVTWCVIAMDTYRNTRRIAQELLSAYPADTVITRELYDADTEFGECLILLNNHFEFPDWDGLTLKRYLKFCGPDHDDTVTFIKIGPIQISMQAAKSAKPRCPGVDGENVWELPDGTKLYVFE